jgi:hypothetical protein
MSVEPDSITLVTRLIESSPVIVAILLVACSVLWRTLREEMKEWRSIAKTNTDAVHALTAAVERLREKIDGA